MPYLLGERHAPDFRGRPTHMPPRDYALWLAWQPLVRSEVIAFYFDVNLGSGRQVPNAYTPELAAMWYKLTTKRADVIALTRTHAWLIELHDPAGATSLGRLALYRHLYLADPPFSLPLRSILVSSADDPDVAELAQQLGIEFHVVQLSRFRSPSP